jgi:Antibiotic biosynthesis monooxygenase
VLVVTRFRVDEPAQPAFVDSAQAALAVLAGCRGYVRGQLARAVDDPGAWCLVTEWESVGAYRRGLSSFEVKLRATPLLAGSLDEPSAYEVLASAPPGGPVSLAESDRAAGGSGPLRSRI